jgi:hypothetical protein
MAALVLNVAQAALQAVAYRAIGSLFADDVEGSRLSALHVMSSTDGAGMPILFGRARIAGQLIWAARFTERAVRSSAGGKGGGPTRTDYRYSASFAVGLCEGPIDGLGRIWADGRLLDLSGATTRLYVGTEDQEPDPLIEAVEGAGDPPAFRGTAYIVFEDLPLEAFGNRVPQLTFEVFRAPVAADGSKRLEDLVRGVTLIPGSGEFAYGTTLVAADLGYGRERSENALNSRGLANIEAALDDLQARLPNCESVMLVVAWFGDDLRCGSCAIRPGVETRDKLTRPYAWTVNSVGRQDAYLVSTTDGRPTYGGTPSDACVLEAIAAIKARGLKVGLYPFILMDVSPGNGLPDPYGGGEQAAFPWRGRIACHPAPGVTGTPDKTAAAGDQVRAFFGDCAPGDFLPAGSTVGYSGPDEWSFRRFILHHAHLAALAGGVDVFLIGSEMRGLTTVRESASSYPAVAELVALATDVRSVVGAATKLSYSADWSEYFGHQPQDGSGDVYFHLDSLWGAAAIDFVGIDWYAPLSDWRGGSSHLDAAVASSIHDLAYLDSNVEGGEGFDWFYASPEARDDQDRAPITDGAAGRPWVFRCKDLRSWWSEPHYNRPGGVEAATPTAWVPQSKPIWFIELGCPAVDKGSNQPNVFVDPKSSESFLPHYSTGARDDLIQRRVLEALLSHWDPDAGHNPTSSIYGGSMIATDRAHVWTWDARPFPDFPARSDIWSDGANWRLGHWLTGRVGLAPLALVVEDLARRVDQDVDASSLEGLVAGYVIGDPTTARAALEPLARLHGFGALERDGRLAFVPADAAPAVELDLDELVLDEEVRRLLRSTEDVSMRPLTARIGFLDELRDYRSAWTSTRIGDGAASPAIAVSAPVVLDPDSALRSARTWLAEAAAGAEGVQLRLPPSALALEAGDLVGVEGRAYRIDRIEDGPWREAQLTAVASARRPVVAGGEAGSGSPPLAPPATPYGVVLDLPLLPGEEVRGGPLVATAADPWPGAVAVGAGVDASSVTERARATGPSVVGELLWDLYPGPVGRWDEGNYVRIRLVGGAVQSVTEAELLGGANRLAVEGPDGEWEILQFREAALVALETYEIRGLLRGQLGTEAGMASPVAAGARLVLLGDGEVATTLSAHERNVSLEWRLAPRGRPFTDPTARALTAIYEARDLRPLSPVHLWARRSGGDLVFGWTRRTRLGGDDWVGLDVPLAESVERYLFELLDGGDVVLAREVAEPSVTVTAPEEAAALPGGPHTAFEVRVSQISEACGPGAPRRAFLYL